MAKITRRKRRRRRRDTRIPLAVTMSAIGTILGPAPGTGRSLLDTLMAGDVNGFLYDAREKFAGIDAQGKFQPTWVLNTYTPLIMGALVSKFAGKFVNPHLRKIPFLGKYIKA